MQKLPKSAEKFIENVDAIYPAPGSKAFQGFEINDTLFIGQSPYQDVAIYTNDALGTVLVLDGIVQITTRDEFVYQEMMTHVPMFAHGQAKNVLVIGGGDGGILREVLRHNTVEHAVMAEIDQMVIDACVQYMPEINHGGKIYNDPRAELIVGDAFEYVRNTNVKFDVVIIDSTDPIGPGEKLFTSEFYTNLSGILAPRAFISTQGGVPFFQEGEIATTVNALSDAGLNSSCYIAAIPTYYGGYMTMGFATNTDHAAPSIDVLNERFNTQGFATKHYSPAIHQASFVLPPWIAAQLSSSTSHKKAA